MPRSTSTAVVVALGIVLVTGFVPIGTALETEDVERSTAGERTALDTARRALAHSAAAAARETPEIDTRPLVEQQHRNLDTAGDLAAIDGQARDDELAQAIALAERGTEHQLATLGVEEVDPAPQPEHATPSQALIELTHRHDVSLDEDQRAQLDRLDALEEPLPTALTRVVDGFLALDTATQQAYADADPASLQALRADALDRGPDSTPLLPGSLSSENGPDGRLATADAIGLGEAADPPRPGETLAEAGVDVAPVLATRAQLLDAIHELSTALDEHPPSTSSACDPTQVLPAFSVDLADCDNTYTRDIALVVDAGGSDTYHNNAGGSNLGARADDGSVADEACGLLAPGRYASAALVDLGTDADRYGDPTDARACGVNGGGYLGVGFLLDEGGTETYTAEGSGTNGGASTGVGFLLDGGFGDDTYTAGSRGTNGGANGGVGSLIDGSGSDAYLAGEVGTNGGASAGSGFVYDSHVGNDTFAAGGIGTNGGGYLGGSGFLANHGDGHDEYEANGLRSLLTGGNNGGGNLGSGFLYDTSGDDRYVGEDPDGSNGGAVAGSGTLVDRAGQDSYMAPDGLVAANGGGFGGPGLLVDTSGLWGDRYEDGLVDCEDCSAIKTTGVQLDCNDLLVLWSPQCLLGP